MVDNRRILTCLVEDRPGVLELVVSLFRRRAFNIASLAVGHSECPGLSRMTIDVEAGDVKQVRKQLEKLIDVRSVSDLTNEPIVARGLALIKVRTTSITRGEIIQLVNIFRGNIVDVAPDSLIVEVGGDEEKIDAFIDLLRDFGIEEIMRTGLIAVRRGMPKVNNRWRVGGML